MWIVGDNHWTDVDTFHVPYISRKQMKPKQFMTFLCLMYATDMPMPVMYYYM